MLLTLLPVRLIPVKAQIRLVWEEDMGYAESGAHVKRFADDQIVFGLFLAVSPPPYQVPSLLKGQRRIGICRCYTSSGC